jgi:hypothetical protein
VRNPHSLETFEPRSKKNAGGPLRRILLFPAPVASENFTEAAFQIGFRSFNVEYLYGRPPARISHE